MNDNLIKALAAFTFIAVCGYLAKGDPLSTYKDALNEYRAEGKSRPIFLIVFVAFILFLLFVGLIKRWLEG